MVIAIKKEQTSYGCRENDKKPGFWKRLLFGSASRLIFLSGRVGGGGVAKKAHWTCKNHATSFSLKKDHFFIKNTNYVV